MNFDSEAAAHLELMCEQLDTQAKAFCHAPDEFEQHTLQDTVSRIRNMLVVLEKSASQYIVEDFQVLLDKLFSQNAVDVTGKQLLQHAVTQIARHIGDLRNDVNGDSALTLIPLVNDFCAFREEILISDVIMLSAGTDLLAIAPPDVTQTQWVEERDIWKTHLNAVPLMSSQLLSQWREGTIKDALPTLVEQLEVSAELCRKYACLDCLAALFESASLIADALGSDQIHDGPAITSLYALLDQHLGASAGISTADDLVPHDVLRNFLYYVAQIDTDNTVALDLRRRFQLDCVRQVNNGARHGSAANVSVCFQLVNAIRNSITRESESLRTWLDEPDKTPDKAKVARLKVRLAQLEPVLRLLGAAEAHLCLETIGKQIGSLSNGHNSGALACRKLARSMAELDRLLDIKARQSLLLQNQPEPAGTKADSIDESALFRQVSIDACLFEARREIQDTANQLLPSIRMQRYDNVVGVRLAARLAIVKAALDIIPLSDINPLFSLLVSAVYRLSCLSVASPVQVQASTPRQSQDEAEQAHVLCDLLRTVFDAVDNYLLCALQPQQSADQFLSEAESALQSLHAKLGKSYEDAQSSTEEKLNELSQLDAELFSEGNDTHGLFAGSNVQLVFRHDCFSHLQTLDDCVKKALKPNNDRATHLPNEQMLRSLHWLTSSAQTMGASTLIEVVQPLQRAALVFQREERFFDAQQTRCTGALLNTLCKQFDTIISADAVEETVPALREQSAKLQAAIAVPPGDSLLDNTSAGGTNSENQPGKTTLGSENSALPQADAVTDRNPISLPAAVVVDDSGAVRRSAGLILEKWGYKVVYGRSEISALDQKISRKNNVLVVSLQLLRRDKSDLLQRIKNTPDLLIFALSQSDSDKARELSDDLGAACVLLKPFTEADFQKALEEAGLSLPDPSVA